MTIAVKKQKKAEQNNKNKTSIHSILINLLPDNLLDLINLINNLFHINIFLTL